MGAWAEKFAEWTFLGGYFAVIFTVALISWPLLPDAIEWVQTGIGQLIPVVIMDFVAALWREPDMRSLIIYLATAAGFIILIVIGAGFAASPGMVWWEIAIFKRVLREDGKLLDGYVQRNMPHLRDDYNILADPKEKVTVYNWKRNSALWLAYHRVTGAFNDEISENAWVNSAPWRARKEQPSRIFRRLAFITYVVLVIAVLSQAWVIAIAIKSQAVEFSTWQYFLKVFLIGLIYTDFIGRVMRRAVIGLWRSMFVSLSLLHEKQRSAQPHAGEAASLN